MLFSLSCSESLSLNNRLFLERTATNRVLFFFLNSFHSCLVLEIVPFPGISVNPRNNQWLHLHWAWKCSHFTFHTLLLATSHAACMTEFISSSFWEMNQNTKKTPYPKPQTKVSFAESVFRLLIISSSLNLGAKPNWSPRTGRYLWP